MVSCLQPRLPGGAHHLLEAAASCCKVGCKPEGLFDDSNSSSRPTLWCWQEVPAGRRGKLEGRNPSPVFHVGPSKVEDVETLLWCELLPEVRNVRSQHLSLPLLCLPIVMAPRTPVPLVAMAFQVCLLRRPKESFLAVWTLCALTLRQGPGSNLTCSSFH